VVADHVSPDEFCLAEVSSTVTGRWSCRVDPETAEPQRQWIAFRSAAANECRLILALLVMSRAGDCSATRLVPAGIETHQNASSAGWNSGPADRGRWLQVSGCGHREDAGGRAICQSSAGCSSMPWPGTVRRLDQRRVSGVGASVPANRNQLSEGSGPRFPHRPRRLYAGGWHSSNGR